MQVLGPSLCLCILKMCSYELINFAFFTRAAFHQVVDQCMTSYFLFKLSKSCAHFSHCCRTSLFNCSFLCAYNIYTPTISSRQENIPILNKRKHFVMREWLDISVGYQLHNIVFFILLRAASHFPFTMMRVLYISCQINMLRTISIVNLFSIIYLLYVRSFVNMCVCM